MSFDQGHALLIGIGTHKYLTKANVPITAKDAQAVAEVVQDARACGYLPFQVKLIHDGQATKQGILNALDELCGLGEQDTVFLFYSGHGAYGTDGKYYLVSHDAQAQDERVVAGTGVSEDELLVRLRGIPAQRVLMILNACHSGDVSPELEITSPEVLKTQNPSEASAIALLGTGKGRIIITACRQEQVSYVGPGPLTVFTKALVGGLRGEGGISSGGLISVFDLYRYLFQQVRDWSAEQNKPVQEPELTVIKGVGPFAVSLYRGASKLGTFNGKEAPPLDAAVRAIRQERVESHFAHVVHQGRSSWVNIEASGGDIHVGGSIVGGDMINAQDSQGFVNQSSNVDVEVNASRIAFGILINELVQKIAELDLDDDERQVVEQDAASVQDQLQQHHPKLLLIRRGLNSIKEVVEGAAGAAAAGASLAPLIQRGLEMAQQLFK